MKKILKYLLIFIIAYIVINIGLKFYIATQWRENPQAISKLIKHCTHHTKTIFNTLDLKIEEEAKNFILSGKTFSNKNKPEVQSYKKCISKAIYYHAPQEYFNENFQ